MLTADCAPIVLFDPNKEIISVIHAGWRGALSGIVRNVTNFFIKEGECFSIVGESGSGKSVTAMSMMNLLKENKKTMISGRINFGKKNANNF